MAFIDLPIVKSSEINQALKRANNAKIQIEDTAVRGLAKKTTVGSAVRWSDFVGAGPEELIPILTAASVQFGLNLSFAWNQEAFGNDQDISDYFPQIVAGDQFSVIVGQVGGWANSNANRDFGTDFVYPLWEILFTYGTARTVTKLAGYSIGSGSGNFKGSFFDVIYNGADRIRTKGFYSGGKTNANNGTNYVLGLTFIPDVTADKALTGFTVTNYANTYPADTTPIIP
jgi:hypothetical protein